MKVIYCLHHFLPEYVAGTEVYAFNLAKNLKTIGIDVVILIPGFDKEATDEYIYNGIRVIRYAENSIEDRSMILGKKEPDGINEFKQILLQEKPDILHFHELAPGRGINIFHAEVANQLHIKIVVTFHLSHYSCYVGCLVYNQQENCDGVINLQKCTKCAYSYRGINQKKSKVLAAASMMLYNLGVDSRNWNNPLGTALGFPFAIEQRKKDLVRLADMSICIISLTKWYKKVLEKNGIAGDKIKYVPQGLTADKLHLKRDIKTSSLPLQLIFIGRISFHKGVHLLIEAIKQLPPDKVTIHFYGPDTEDDYAVECKRSTSAMPNVLWKGSIPSSDVINTLELYDCLCLPSTFSEMSPLVIQEAFAAGIPVLASDVYGNAEQITHDVNGWLFRFKDSNDLKDKISVLINNPVLIDEAKKNIPDTILFRRVAEEHYKIYQSALQILSSENIH